MGDSEQAPVAIISTPKGGGAVRGLGETFQTNPHTGTGSLAIPLEVPPGRSGFAPILSVGYSSGDGNGWFGAGWSLSVPGITRKTSRGIPTYDDDTDVFILSGSEDLVVIAPTGDGGVAYRPRTEGLYASIVHYRDRQAGHDYWQVRSKDGLLSWYGSSDAPDPAGRDPAVVADPDDPEHIFAWRLTQTQDLLGNRVMYDYDVDSGDDRWHRWRQPILRAIRYVDYVDSGGVEQFFAAVTFTHEARPDPFSVYTSGFEVRTTRRYAAITTTVFPGRAVPVRRYEFRYQAARETALSLLSEVEVVGFDDAGTAHRDLPPLLFGYSDLRAEDQRFQAVAGSDLPGAPLSDPDLELVDLTGDGLPDLLQCNGTIRYWRNRGNASFDLARPMAAAPTGISLGQPGVRLLDVDGDGRADLMVSTPERAGFYPLRFGPRWGPHRQPVGGSLPDIGDQRVKLLDLDGDGVTDALQTGGRGNDAVCWFNNPDLGWSGPRPVRWPAIDAPPAPDLTDPRVRFADITGDGASDLVIIRGRSVDYWPNLGRGRFGRRNRMAGELALPAAYDPRRLHLGDVSGNGVADLVYVDSDRVTIWFNQSGNGWSAPKVVRGLPTDGWDVRLVDLLGIGTAGLLCTRAARTPNRPDMYFLQLTGTTKPGLLTSVDNQIGAQTTIGYVSSSALVARDQRTPATRWRTPLPFPTWVVSRMQTTDLVSGTTQSKEFDYRHGYWDGRDREFRGFARVEQTDTERRAAGLPESPPPTLTRTWFDIGPVDADDIAPIDVRTEYWTGDPPLLDAEGGLPSGLPRAAKRSALRARRGHPLRVELYGLDSTRLQDRPYRVVEFAYELHQEISAGEPVFAVREVAQRTTEWERGADPRTTFVFTGDFDVVGQPGRTTTVVPPRRRGSRWEVSAAVVGTVQPDPVVVLATHQRTRYATPADVAGPVDRVADVRRYELRTPPPVAESDPQHLLRDQTAEARRVRDLFDDLGADEVKLTSQLLHHYDGAAYEGLAVGIVGAYGLLTRTESLVYTDELLQVYGDWRPAYLGGSAALPAGPPAGFVDDLGYRFQQADGWHTAGWYADTVRRAYDVQLSTAMVPLPERGLILGLKDPHGQETRITPDEFSLTTVRVRDPVGLETVADQHYRTGQPARVVDPNGVETHLRYHPLGLVAASFRVGPDGRGGTADQPDVAYEYNLTAFRDRGQPMLTRTRRRVQFASDQLSDEVLESWEYADGVGRVVQHRAAIDDLAFETDDTGLLVPDPVTGVPTNVPGETGGPAKGTRRQDRVVVTGWEVFDAKGRIVRKYEPFFATGIGFVRPSARGSAVEMSYDPLGRLVRVTNPDGSQRRTVFGSPVDLADPDVIEPSPWVQTGYDENDLAPFSVGPDGTTMAGRVPADQHLTPTTALFDGLGRTVCSVSRGTANPATWRLTRTAYELDGTVRNVTDELGRTALIHHYDLLGRRLATESIDAGRTIAVLDAAGRLRHTRDARGAQQLRSYDDLGRLSELWACDAANRPAGLRQRNAYGDGGISDQPNADRQAARDALCLGRTVEELDESGLTVVVRYDLTGAVAEESRQLVSDDVLAALATDADWVPDWSTMDPNQQLESSGEPISSIRDALGRIVQRRLPADSSGHRPVLAAAFARSGGLRSVELDNHTHVALVIHNARGQRLLQAYGNGLVTRFGYDPLTFRQNRRRTEPMTRTGDVWTSSGAALEDLTFGYDLVGNLSVIEERTPGCGIAGTTAGRDRLVRTFQYDGFNRLLAATGRECAAIATPRPLTDQTRCGWSGPGAAAPNQANAPELVAGYEESYSYDPIGNLLDLRHRRTSGPTQDWHRRFGLDGSAPDDWAQAASNRMTTLEAGQSVQIYGYDEAGQLIRKNAGETYRWDHAGRLTTYRVQAGQTTSVLARYLYDADGNRVKKWVRRGGAAGQDESIDYLADTFERHRWAKAGGGSNALVLLGHDGVRFASVRLGPAHPDDTGPAVCYQLSDDLGSCLTTVDDTGGWVNREEYLPYGETSFGSFARKRYRFVGKERDEESGLVYHGARYYDPGLVRWTSPDPADPRAGPPRTYIYCGGRPLVSADPDGAHPILLLVVAAVLVSLALPNTANAPGPNDPTYPSMSEGEFAVKAGAMLAAGPVGGAVEVGVATRVGVGLGGRALAAGAGVAVGGGAAGLGLQATDDAFRGQLSSAGQYLKSVGTAVAATAVGRLFGGSPVRTPVSARSPYSNLEVRQWANDAEVIVKAYQQTPAFQQMSLKQQAQLSVTLRNSITGEARSMMPQGGLVTEPIKGFENFVGRTFAESDAARYGPGGRTYGNLYNKNAAALEKAGTNPTADAVHQRMIEGATRPNRDVNAHVGAKRD